MSLFLLAGLRYAFTVPAELRANWIFQLADGSDSAGFLAGARKAVVLVGIVPLFGVLLPVHSAIWGWRIAGLHIGYGFVVSCPLMDALLVGLEKLPFTCSYVPGKANLKASWPLYLAGYLAYVSVFSGIEYLILQQPIRMACFLALAALIKLGIESYRRRLLAGNFALLFDERPEPAVRTLELQQSAVTARRGSDMLTAVLAMAGSFTVSRWAASACLGRKSTSSPQQRKFPSRFRSAVFGAGARR